MLSMPLYTKHAQHPSTPPHVKHPLTSTCAQHLHFLLGKMVAPTASMDQPIELDRPQVMYDYN